MQFGQLGHKDDPLKNQSYDLTDGNSIVVIKRRNGDSLLAKVSTSKLPAVAAISGSWCALTTREGATYAYAKDYSGRTKGTRGGGKNIYMHRIVAGLADGDPMQANHISWDTLDCSDGNIEILTHAENTAHRRLSAKTPNNNSTGFRNVYRVQFGFEVVVARKYIGFSKDLAVAARMAAKARAERNSTKLAEAVARKQAQSSAVQPQLDYANRMSNLHDRIQAAQRRAA